MAVGISDALLVSNGQAAMRSDVEKADKATTERTENMHADANAVITNTNTVPPALDVMSAGCFFWFLPGILALD